MTNFIPLYIRRRSRKSQNFIKWILKLLLFLFFCFYLHIDLRNYQTTAIDKFKLHVPMKKVSVTNLRNNSMKYILFWTTWWYFPYWYMGGPLLGEEFLKSIDCPVTNCVFSHDRNFLPRPTDYDALVFHIGDAIDNDDLPSARREEQIYIVANEETTYYTWHDMKFDNDFFNMTMTFRFDADIFWNYGVFTDLETGSFVSPSKYAKWREPEVVDDPEVLNLSKSKTKLAAWFLSHCGVVSNRENLTQAIQKFMPVDIYGLCGNLTCPMGRTIYETDKGRQNCTSMLNSTYKFYLSFENSICTDYMTEKVYLNMENYIVPILYNGITDMQHFLPPHSYIHVNHSSSVEDLVNYLKYLDKNPQEYANYFWWKKYYNVTENVHKYSYCDMCQKINKWNVKQKRKSYNDFVNWNNYKTCYKMGVDF